MRITQKLSDRLPERPRAVVVGAFDGLHIGHQYLIRQTCAEAAATGLESTVFTFEPLPKEFLSPHTSQGMRLTLADERIEVMRQFCVDRLLIADFDTPFSQLTAEQFVRDILVDRLTAKTLVAAENHSFGHGAQADISAIKMLSEQYGLRLIVLPLLQLNGMRVSSTEVRRFLREGHVEEAASLLGRQYSMYGEVISGKGMGRGLGFPTANLSVPNNKLVPAAGVYAGLADGPSLRTQLQPLVPPYPTAISIGPQPTFGVTASAVEAHIISPQELDLRGSRIEIRFVRRLRSIEAFACVDALKSQMAHDVEATVNLLCDIC